MFTLKVSQDIELRLLEERHAEEIFALVEANRAHLRQWLAWVDEEVSAAQAREYIQIMHERYLAVTGLAMGVWFKDVLAGCIGFVSLDLHNRLAEIGYWLGESAQGHGIITQSCRTMIEYAFDGLKLNRIVIRCAEGNHRSRTVAERLGFKCEGRLRQTIWLYDRFWDALIYGMLASEWAAQQPDRTGGKGND